MSFILDALRRADAERDRGEVPGLHARHFDAMPAEDEPGARSRRPLWVIGGLALALVAALGWILFGHDPTRTPAVVAGGTVSTMPSAATLPSAAPPIAPPAPGPGATLVSKGAGPSAAQGPATVAAAAEPPASAIAAARAARAARRAAARAASAVDGGAGSERTRNAATGPERGASASPGAAAEPANRIYQPKELPDAIRRELPTINVGGSTYSSERANRMLMINGQIFHEGDAVARGVVLEQIRPRAAVFVYKGYRYESTF